MFLTDAEKLQLRQQIRAVESKTDAEIVTVIAHSSDSYTYIPVLWAALIALCLPGMFFLLVESTHNGWTIAEDMLGGLQWVYIAQVLLFLVLMMLFQWQPLQLSLIPNSVKRRRAHRHAQTQFVEQRLHWSTRRAGILLFVSIAEHYVEIIADKAIAEKVENRVWEQAIEHFSVHVRQGRVAMGFATAIDDCQDVLLQHFPAGKPAQDGADYTQYENELPDHLIEV